MKPITIVLLAVIGVIAYFLFNNYSQSTQTASQTAAFLNGGNPIS